MSVAGGTLHGMDENNRRDVTELRPGMTGRWLVRTRNSEHVWDLDEMAYTRRPGTTSSQMAYDGVPVLISRVQRWPCVGSESVVWFDDPLDPLLEQYRISSTIASITRLEDSTRES